MTSSHIMPLRCARRATFAAVGALGAIVAFAVAADAQQRQPSSSPSSLYVPRDVRRAYEKKTRSPDGRPGPAYWQNRARYTITVETAPPNRRVTGTERITYFNQSPDTLRTLGLRQPSLDPRDSVLVAWMVTRELGRLLSL